MIAITFSDRETEKRALAFLLGRFSGSMLRSGEHLVPEAALEALARQNISFSVTGNAAFEQQVAGAEPAVESVLHDNPRPVFGSCRGMLTIVSDDDEHLKDFADYMP